MRLRPYHLGLVGLIGVTVLIGCDDDGPGVDPTEPSLTRVLGMTECGRNLLPVPTREEFTEGRFRKMQLVVSGTDPRNSNQQITVESSVVIGQQPEGGAGQVVAFTSAFEAARAAGVNILEAVQQATESNGVVFRAGSANDSVFCTGAGTAFLTARMDDYRPGGDGDPIDLKLANDRRFQVRCVAPAQYEELCGTPIEIDAGFDGGMDDGGTDGGSDGGEDVDMGSPLPPLWGVRFLPPADPNVMIIGIRNTGLGRQDNVLLQFQVAEAQLPLGNILVKFVRGGATQPGVTISGDGNIVSQDDNEVIVRTTPEGLATVRLIAGGTPGLASVQAVALRYDPEDLRGCEPSDANCLFDEYCGRNLERIDREVACQEDRSGQITIVAGIPSGRGFQLRCDDPVLPAFSSREGERWLLASEIGTNCTLQALDRVNDRVGEGNQIVFLTEAGSVQSPIATDNEGRATTVLNVGEPAPFDVESFPYEIAAGFQRDGFNPRDGLVRVVAVTRGEEDFTDTNGDKIFNELDTVEPGQDLPEPFIDANDNGTWDPDEEYRDANGNEFWDDANGEWDANTEVWASTTVLWVGNMFSCWDPFTNEYLSLPDCGCVNPITGDDLDPRPEGCTDNVSPERNLPLLSLRCGSACSSANPFNEFCPPADFYLDPGAGGTVEVEGRFFDINGNCLGGRGDGRFSIQAMEMVGQGQMEGPFDERFCEHAFERPIGRPVTATLIDTAMPAPMGARTTQITINVEYQGIGGRRNQAAFTATVCR